MGTRKDMIFHLSIVPALLAFFTNKGSKVIPSVISYSRGVLVSNMAIVHGGGNDFRNLIKHLNIQELRILRREEDLTAHVVSITKLDAEGIRKHMLEEWGLVAESCQNDDWWVDIEGIRDRCPKWARAQIEGTYIDGDDFVNWGRNRLMEEVRVNINIKLIEELRKIKKQKDERDRKELEEEYSEAHMYGMYGTYL